MSQGPCPAAKADRGDVPNRLAIPATRLIATTSASIALQLRKRRRCTFEVECFTSLCPFHFLKMVYPSLSQQTDQVFSSCLRMVRDHTWREKGKSFIKE